MSSNFDAPNSSSIQNSSTPLFSLNPAIKQIIFLLNILEILVYFPTIPLVLFCIFLVLKTSILHQNLKWVLGGLNLQVILFALCRLYSFCGGLFSGNSQWMPPQFLGAFNFALIVFGNLVGHALIIERILATILVRKYENYRGPCFTVSWILITVPLSILNAYYQWYLTDMADTAAITLYTHIVAMVASLAEIFIISLVTYMNVKHFKIDDFAPKVHPLTVRYQLTENIRTGKQLAPTFICHFISVTLSFLIIMNGFFQCIEEFNTIFLLISIAFDIHAINNFMLISTLIICHPMLNRKARKLFNGWRMFCAKSKLVAHQNAQPQNNNIAPAAPQSIPTAVEVCPLPVDAKGMAPQLKRKSQELRPADAYFRQLHRAWGDYLH